MIEENYIFLNSNLQTKEEVIEFISNKALELKLSTDKDKLKDDILAREKEFSTDLGMGISIPHTKSAAVLSPAILFIRYQTPIAWGEDSKVKCSIAFLSPASNEDNIHLKMLSNVSRKLINKDFLNLLMESGTKEQIYNGLKDALNRKDVHND